MSLTSSTNLKAITSIAPLLSVRQGAKAVEFYKTAFGGSELYRIDIDDGSENFSPETLGGGTVRMVMVVDDPDASFDRAVTAGATVVTSTEDQDGWRLGRVVDPFGHHWEIGKPMSE